eukprot:788430-Amorphochlora_amoeboformis.AAC.1
MEEDKVSDAQQNGSEEKYYYEDQGDGEGQQMEPAPELMFTEEVNSPLLDLLRDAPASQKEIVTRLLDGQRFIHLVRPKFGFWKRKKCHLVLTQIVEFTEQMGNGDISKDGEVWDWYNGLVKVKMLVACLDSIESGMMDTERKRNDEERALKAIMSRKSWHKKALTWGTVFTRAFVGGMLRDSK